MQYPTQKAVTSGARLPTQSQAPSAASVLLTLLTVAAAGWVQWSVHRLAGAQFPYLMFYVAVVVATWRGGTVPGLIALVAGFLTGSFLFVPPGGMIVPLTAAGWVSAAFYILASAVTIHFAHRQAHAFQRAESSTAEAKNTAVALRATETRFRAAHDSNPEGFMLLNAEFSGHQDITDFSWTYANEAAAWMMGSRSESLVGARMMRDRPVPADPELFSALVGVMESGRPFVREQRFERDGGEFYQRLLVARTPEGVALSFTDLTERRRAEEAMRTSEKRFRTLVSVITDVPWSSDPTGAFVTPQTAWERYTGQTWEQHSGFGWINAFHVEDQERIRRRWLSACTDRSLFETRGLLWHAPSRDYRHFVSRATPVYDAGGTVTEWVGTCTDVHEQKTAEIELQKRLAEIQELNRRLERAMQETHHRVKNNLQVVAAMVDMLFMEDHQIVPKDELRRLGVHVRSLAAVHDVLTHQGSEGGPMDRMSLNETINRVLKMLRMLWRDKPMHAEVEDVTVHIRQGSSIVLLLNELVSNSIKHGACQVWVKVRALDNRAYLEVSDDGPGFPPGFQPATFSNIGIDLVENLARWDLFGETRYENRPEGGARVTISFPVAYKVCERYGYFSDVPA